MLCCKMQRKCSDSTYVEIAFLLIFGVLWPITVVTEVSFIIIFFYFLVGPGSLGCPLLTCLTLSY